MRRASRPEESALDSLKETERAPRSSPQLARPVCYVLSSDMRIASLIVSACAVLLLGATPAIPVVSTITTPPLSANAPGGTITTPALSANAPGGTITTPALSATAPGGTITTPALSANAPGGTITTPALSASAPGGTITTPALSANAPRRP